MNKIRKTNREGIRNALCILAVLLFLQCSLVENLASQTLSGKIFTVEVGGDTVPVYMARLQWLHTAVGAHTKKDGSYQLPFSRTDTLIVSYSFYTADTLVVSAEESHRDFFINTSQALQEVKKRGEQTSAKLLLPIMLLFALTLLLVVAPAVMNMQAAV